LGRGTVAADYELKIYEIHFPDSKTAGEPTVAQADPAEDDIPYSPINS
jgi:hypothetical protein